jgi:23S rRNA (cytidine1920-2'-O)/16S rRNA (cytidine1409-2'-O)-methyltransferase
VRRGHATTRERAQADIAAGRVLVGGAVAAKASRQVGADEAIVLQGAPPPFVSRGGEKLAGALDRFGVDPAGRRVLDAGASTGGFSDCLLQRGAAAVVAVDVGYGQLHEKVRADPRVTVRDRTNVRALTLDDVGPPVDLVVADLSFISLRLVLDALVACTAPGGDLVPMVKPQFEVGRDRLGSGGVVRDPRLRASAVLDVVAAARARGLALCDVVASPLPGPSGNVEYFCWLRRGDGSGTPTGAGDDEALVRRAVEAGPA